MAGKVRRYASEEVGQLGRLLRDRFPRKFDGAGGQVRLTRFECPEVKTCVWMAGFDDDWIPPAGWRGVLVPRRFDPEMTVRRVEKVLRRQARAMYGARR